MDGSTIISPIVPNSRQTPNISALAIRQKPNDVE